MWYVDGGDQITADARDLPMKIKWNVIRLVDQTARAAVSCCLLVYAVSPIARAQRPAPRLVSTPKVQLEGSAAEIWKVDYARLVEDFNGTGAFITLRNVSTLSVLSAMFYGEYFDARGRLCFTGLFHLKNNFARRSDVVQPGGLTSLVSDSYALAPASRPRRISLYRVRQTQRRAGRGGAPPAVVRTPLTLEGLGVPVSALWPRVCTGPSIDSLGPPVVDLALAKIHVGADGALLELQILDALAAQPYIPWLQNLSTHLRFNTAKLDGVASPGDTLVLVRALVRGWQAGERAYLPRSDLWVAAYASNMEGRTLLPLNVLVVEKPPLGLRRDSTSCFEYLADGSAWSIGAGVLGASPPQPPGRYFKRER